MTYTFKIREGVTWHDGTPFCLEDIIFTYNALTKDENLTSSILSNYEDIASVSSPAPQLLEIKMKRYNAAMLGNFTIGIIPKHLFEGKDINTAPANHHPIGTGRYKFIEWDTAGGMIILERNENY